MNECFVLGNGPSLAHVPNELLSMLPTFGTNRVYLKYLPTYYVCINDFIAKQSAAEIEALESVKFVTERVPLIRTIPLHSGSLSFSLNPLNIVFEGHTVTVVALQLALFMGYKRVYLLGVDHSYAMSPGDPNAPIKWDGFDVNHFDGTYMRQGEDWNVPDLAASELAYVEARNVFYKYGGSIINLSDDSKLDVFPHMNICDFLCRQV